MRLVRYYEGVDGLKTGYTENAGYCLTATIKKDNLRLIAVVMGEESSKERNEEVSNLLDYGYNAYQKDIYITTDEIIDNVNVEKGKILKANIVPIEDVGLVNEKGHKMGEVTYETKIDSLVAPINRGDKVGTLSIYEDKKLVREVDVTVNESIEKIGIIRLYFRYLKDMLTLNI